MASAAMTLDLRGGTTLDQMFCDESSSDESSAPSAGGEPETPKTPKLRLPPRTPRAEARDAHARVWHGTVVGTGPTPRPSGSAHLPEGGRWS